MPKLSTCPRCESVLPAGAPEGLCPRCLLSGVVHDTAAESAEGSHGTAPTTLWQPGQKPPTVSELNALFPQLEILELIGVGGMGAVYKARQTSLDRIVALKVLPPQAAQDESFTMRFHREARTLARLNHPHIVGVFDCGQAGELFYLLMEYVDGINLRQALHARQSGGSDALEGGALTIVSQACEALQYAHEQGIVHRDIKPENILINRQGQVKVADFGLAKLLEKSPDELLLTGTRQVMGTPHYMAPEQIETPQQVDHRADIYSLGVVCYELLTGQLPIGRFAAPSIKSRCDQRLDAIVHRALERDADARYQQAGELKRELDEHMSGALAQIDSIPPQAGSPKYTPEAGTPALPAPPRHSPGSFFWTAPAVAILLFGLLVVLLQLFLGRALLSLGAMAMALLFFIAIGGLFIARLRHAGKQHPTLYSSLGVDALAASQARRRLRPLGIAFQITGAINLLIAVSLPFAPVAEAMPTVGFMALPLLTFLTGILLLAAGSCVRRQALYPFCLIVAIAAILPLSLCWPVNIFLGIWALSVLLAPETRQAFRRPESSLAHSSGDKAMPLHDMPHSEPPGRSRGAWLIVTLILLLVGLAIGGSLLGYLMLARVAPAPQVPMAPPAPQGSMATHLRYHYEIGADSWEEARQLWPQIHDIVMTRLQEANLPYEIQQEDGSHKAPEIVFRVGPVAPAKREQARMLTGSQGRMQFGMIAHPTEAADLMEGTGVEERDTPTDRTAQWVKLRAEAKDAITTSRAITRVTSDGKSEVLVILSAGRQGLTINNRDILEGRINESVDNFPALALEFTPQGVAKMKTLTERNALPDGEIRQLAVILDDQLLTAPTIMDPVSSQVMLTGEFSREFLESIRILLKSGELPAPLKQIQEWPPLER